MNGRRSGLLLVELTLALTLLTIGIMGFLAGFAHGFRGHETFEGMDEARIALANTAEMLRGQVFEDLYNDYHGTTINVPELEDPGGGPATVQITCFVDETAIPPEFGPIFDLDGVGGLENTDCSGDYHMLPVRLGLTYVGPGGNPISRATFFVLDGGG